MKDAVGVNGRTSPEISAYEEGDTLLSQRFSVKVSMKDYCHLITLLRSTYSVKVSMMNYCDLITLLSQIYYFKLSMMDYNNQ